MIYGRSPLSDEIPEDWEPSWPRVWPTGRPIAHLDPDPPRLLGISRHRDHVGQCSKAADCKEFDHDNPNPPRPRPWLKSLLIKEGNQDENILGRHDCYSNIPVNRRHVLQMALSHLGRGSLRHQPQLQHRAKLRRPTRAHRISNRSTPMTMEWPLRSPRSRLVASLGSKRRMNSTKRSRPGRLTPYSPSGSRTIPRETESGW